MNKRIGEAFDRIHAEEELKNKTMEFLARQTGGFGQHSGQFPRQRKTLSYGKMAAAAAVLALILLGSGGYRLYFIPTTSIDIEINPSVTLGINRFDKVVTMESHNEDGSELLDSVNVKYADYTDAINKIITDESIADYLAQNEIMEISVTGSDDKKNQEIFSGVESCTSRHKNIQCYNGNSELAAEAREAGLSMGKYQVYLELQEQNSDITVKDLQGKTMREICDMVDEMECGEAVDMPGKGEGKRIGHGNGNAGSHEGGQRNENGTGAGKSSGNEKNHGNGNNHVHKGGRNK